MRRNLEHVLLLHELHSNLSDWTRLRAVSPRNASALDTLFFTAALPTRKGAASAPVAATKTATAFSTASSEPIASNQ